MIGRALMVIIFSSIGALAAGWWVNHQAIVSQQEYDIQKFMHSGPRFTGYDGQELCERVKLLEQFSIGFRKSGRKALDCNYGKQERP